MKDEEEVVVAPLEPEEELAFDQKMGEGALRIFMEEVLPKMISQTADMTDTRAMYPYIPDIYRTCTHSTLERILSFVPNSSDVIISTYPKSGTTWTSQIVHQIMSDGNCEFETIGDVVPFQEMVYHIQAVNEQFDHPLLPRSGSSSQLDASKHRVIKTHMPYRYTARQEGSNCKYIYVGRWGGDVFVSYYFHYLLLFGIDPNKVSLHQFVDWCLASKVMWGDWAQHVLSWWEHKDDEDVLFLTYEDLKTDLRHCVTKLMQFVGVDENKEVEVQTEEGLVKRPLIDIVVENSSFKYMKDNAQKFDFAWYSKYFGMNEQKTKYDFIRKGVCGEGQRNLREDQLERLTENFNKILVSKGFPADMRVLTAEN